MVVVVVVVALMVMGGRSIVGENLHLMCSRHQPRPRVPVPIKACVQYLGRDLHTHDTTVGR